MSKIIKKILSFQKRKNGNISILVLIMSLAIILLTTAMVRYIFHDIGFTELDKDKLRALHFAESGLSDMYYKIEQYNKNGVALPPESVPYIVDVPDPDPEGRFTVEYKTFDMGGIPGGYEITSTGIDISSGAARTVSVETWYTDIYDFIFSGKASGAGEVIAGHTNITGPFFVSEILESKLSGNAYFKEGPLYVKGDINIGGNVSIGESANPIILFLGGLFNGEPFDPEDPPSNVYVSDYHNIVIDIEFPTIDSSYINSVVENLKALEIHGNLFIGNGIIKEDGEEIEGGYEDSLNSLKFESGVLKIKGNIVVYGYIEINSKNPIEYSGNANLISTEDITIEAKVRPEDMNNFPSPDLMVLISQYNIDIYAKGGNYEEPDVAAMLIANDIVETQSNNTFLRGSTVSRSLVLGQNTGIHYEAGIGEALTEGVPGLGETMKATLSWQEIIAD